MTTPMRARRAVVAGGSLGGLFAANLLHRSGWDVHVYERVRDELSGRGAGIVTHPELLDILQKAGVTIDTTIGVEVPSRVTLGRGGDIVGERPRRQILTSWGRLYRLLRDALPHDRYHAGKALTTIEQDDRSVSAVFTDGERVTGDLLVGADGIRSTIRNLFLPDVKPVYAGYVAWRGLVEERALTPATHAALFERFAFCLPPHEQMLGYPVAGADDTTSPGSRRWNFVWYRPADEHTELRRLMTDAAGRHYPDGIPPMAIDPKIIREIRETAERVLSPQFAEIVHRADQPFFQPIYDLESPRMVFGRVALLGDAAFVARPHCGMGVTKAASDALALTEALERSASHTEALAVFDEARVRFGTAVVARARQLGAYMQAQIRTAEEREMAERYRTPEAVMRETAVSDGLSERAA